MTAQKQTVILETKRLILRSLRLEDAQSVFDNWTSDKEVAKFMCWDAHSDIEITKEWIKECRECRESMDMKTHFDWGIILKESMDPIGSIGAFICAENADRYEISYELGKKYWRQGYASEGLRCVMNYLIYTVGIRHFICLHAKDNPASGAVMRHVGFEYVKEGSYQSLNGLRKFDSEVYYLDIDE